MRAPILEVLASGEVLVADGATGTMLQAAGLPAGLPGEAWVLERPEVIQDLHRAYLNAGSRLILTSTFGGTRARLEAAGLGPQVAAISRRAAELAREAGGEEIYVGGDIGPTGEMMPPLGKMSFEQAVGMFAEQAAALAAGGVDCIYIETMSDLNEAKAAVTGAQQACDLPVFCTLSFDHHGRTGMGVSPELAAREMAALGVQAVGANCGHAPEEVLDFLPVMAQAAPGLFLIAKPNAGIPRMVQRKAVYDASPERMGALAARFVELGARVVGACCGSSPEHLAAMAAAINRRGGT
jgi:5-methyltetrahydrofolate--homocysteine methyltransferase